MNENTSPFVLMEVFCVRACVFCRTMFVVGISIIYNLMLRQTVDIIVYRVASEMPRVY